MRIWFRTIKIWFDKGFSHSEPAFVVGIFDDVEKANICFNVLKEFINCLSKYEPERVENFVKNLPNEVRNVLKEVYKIDVDTSSPLEVYELMIEDLPSGDCLCEVTRYENVVVLICDLCGEPTITDTSIYGTIMRALGAVKVKFLIRDELAKFIHELWTKDVYTVEKV